MRARKLLELLPSAFVLLINVGVNLSLSAPGAFSLLKPEELSNSDVLDELLMILSEVINPIDILFGLELYLSTLTPCWFTSTK